MTTSLIEGNDRRSIPYMYVIKKRRPERLVASFLKVNQPPAPQIVLQGSKHVQSHGPLQLANQYQVIIPNSLIHARFSGLSIGQKSTWDFAESHAESGSMNISKVPSSCRYQMISQSASMALSFSIQFACPCKDGDSSSPMTIQFLSFHMICSKPKAPLIVPHGSTNHRS